MSEESPKGCTPEQLVERVAREIGRQMHKTIIFNPGENMYSNVARAAIAILRPVVRAEALEEAAKVLSVGDEGHDWSPEGAAAAIRAMIKETE